ncbi:histone-lysine N-methyltransferase SETMAR [Trichonephila clavipes]|nr:histone-lysine N-methyltransferase SETMAR [Trichonephila clavipes]
MEVYKVKIRYILQFCFDKGENASQLAEIVNGVYGADTEKANYVHFWFRQFRSGISDVKDAPRRGRPVVENVDKITEIIEVYRHKLDVWVPHHFTPKNMRNRISICEALAKRKKIDPFLKQMVTGDEKWVTYDNIVRKWSWSKRGEVAQTVAKPPGRFYCVFGGPGKESFIMSCFRRAKYEIQMFTVINSTN